MNVSTSQYQFSHGRTPRGFGSWAFSRSKVGEVLTILFWVHQSKYGDALKAAKAEARRIGATEIEVQT